MYLYPARRTAICGTPPEEKAELRRGKLKKFLPFLWKKGEDRRPVVTVSRTEYFFPDYHLVRVSVARTEGMDKEQAELKLTELKLREQLQELTEDPDHTYVVCREPLSFYFGREFRDYLQQEWIEHLLRYGERPGGYPAWPDLVLLGRNPYLPYVVLRYAARLQSMKWYLTEREYREEEEWLTGELEDEYGLIPEIRLLAETADYGRVRLQGTKPCVVLDFCDNEKVYGGGLAAGSIWLDFPASEDKEQRALVQEKERRVTSGCPQIRYFSMKKEWKDPRKALEYLDTISKNGYNNSVD